MTWADLCGCRAGTARNGAGRPCWRLSGERPRFFTKTTQWEDAVNVVLVVGERPEQASVLAERLGVLGLETIPSAREWKLAVRCLTTHKVSLILLDVDRNRGSRRFFELVREVTDTPIIARGSASSPDDAIWYLDNGAADYIPRTTPPALLAAKIKSFLRSAQRERSDGFIRLGDLLIDLDRYSVTRSGEP